MISDLRQALRLLFKSPGFTLIAVLTLTLGIGANSAIFSVIDTVLLRPLPFPKPNELAMLWGKSELGTNREAHSFPDYLDFREQARSFSNLAAYTEASTVLGSGTDAHELQGVAATADIFSVLGVSPIIGRAYTRAEDIPAGQVVVFTYEAWQRYFNGDPNLVGRQVRLALRSYTVVGIMPPEFRFPVGNQTEYMTPIQPLVPADVMQRRGSHFFRIVGRLHSGVNVGQADSEVAGTAARLAKEYPDSNADRSATVISLHEDLTSNVRPALLVVLAAVVVVLLIACANVANLLLARATARRREIAIRTALGASRARIVRQLLAEGLLLALFGALGGLLLAWWGVDLLRVMGPQDLPRLHEVRVDAMVVIFTIATACLSTMLFALIPALHATRSDVSSSLQEGNRTGAGPESQRIRGILVVGQIALSLLLLAGAGLLIKSFQNLRTTHPGFDPTQVLTADFVLPGGKYSDPEKQTQFFDRFLPKVASLPGVESAGGAMPLPFSGDDVSISFWIAGRPDPGPANHPDASHITVAGDYFRAMRIPLLTGRVFDRRDTKESVPTVVVNEAFVRKFFPNENPVGQHLLIDHGPTPTSFEIVGVVGNTHHDSLAVQPQPEYYLALSQNPRRSCYLVLRTGIENLSGLRNALRNAIHELDSDVFVPDMVPLGKLINGTLARPKFNMVLLGSFAGVAMILAAIGIYGVIAFGVTQRTREIGIRMALGAQRLDVLRMILWQSMAIVGVGLAVGLFGALALTRWMSSLLYGVSAHDVFVHVFVLILLAGAGLVASYIPARRAMRVDPVVALRYQ
jgi:putative ABC transport system permease protein